MPEAIAGFAAIALALLEVFRVQAFCDVENAHLSGRSRRLASCAKAGTSAVSCIPT
jgi:hypothetical protein